MTCSERTLLAAVTVLALGGCRGAEPLPPVVMEPRILPVAGPVASVYSEISGMDWDGNTLLILPQYPDLLGDFGDQTLFGLPRAQVVDLVEGRTTAPLSPHAMDLHVPAVADSIVGYQGREAIAVSGDLYFMTIEVMNGRDMGSHLVAGRFLREGLELTGSVEVTLPVNLPALSAETLVVAGDRVIVIPEANGLNVNPEPRAAVFGFDLSPRGSLPLPQIEYRVTGATAVDEGGRFWVLNYFFPPERDLLRPAADPEVARFGAPDWLDDRTCIERLLELRITDDDRIVRTDMPPIWLLPRADGRCCNWEAVVRLGDGFLLMADEHPETLLAYVPLAGGDPLP